MWQIINVEPSDGECSICRSHECGVVDGKHQWIMSDYLGQETDRVYIGYKCVQLFAENLGINKEIVEREVHVSPTDGEILQAIKNALELKFNESVLPNGHNKLGDNLAPGSVVYYEEPKNKASHRGKTTTKK